MNRGSSREYPAIPRFIASLLECGGPPPLYGRPASPQVLKSPQLLNHHCVIISASKMSSVSSSPIKLRDWPHSPLHHTELAGTYMVTCATFQKVPLFHGPGRLTFLCNSLFQISEAYGWMLQAWAVFPNHYHFIGECAEPSKLATLVRRLHSATAIAINKRDNAPSRKVWFQFWESRLTFQRSYFARLSYVHHNPVHHGLVGAPSSYPWCSARWFERNANRSFFRTIMNFRSDKLNIPDDFKVTFP